MIKKLSTCLLLVLVLGPTCGAADTSSSVQVQVKSTSLRAQPKHWAPALASLSYGDRLTATSARDGWLSVSAKGTKGYVHTSAVTDKRIVLASSKGADRGLDIADAILAGKGFSKDVEREHAQRNPGLNFSAVNSMERVKASPSQVRAFMQQGKLG